MEGRHLMEYFVDTYHHDEELDIVRVLGAVRPSTVPITGDHAAECARKWPIKSSPSKSRA
jgi:hypothetical protein